MVEETNAPSCTARCIKQPIVRGAYARHAATRHAPYWQRNAPNATTFRKRHAKRETVARETQRTGKPCGESEGIARQRERKTAPNPEIKRTPHAALAGRTRHSPPPCLECLKLGGETPRQNASPLHTHVSMSGTTFKTQTR